MSDPERPSERHAPTTGRPSLVSGEATKRVRVLDGLADAHGNTARAAPSPTRRVAWPLAMAFGLVVMLAIWWWTRPVAETPPATDLASAVAPTTDVRSAPAAEPASAPAVASSASTARIESTPEPRTVATAAPVASASAAIASSPPSPFPMLAERPVVRRDAAARENRTARAAPRDAAKATRTAKTKTVTKADTRHAKAAERRSTTTASRTGRAATGGSDPDVTLLSAMLTRLANESDRPGGASPTTLAQLVGQCERQAATSSIDAFECRRRICAGYWGKADACPAAMAPKSN